MKNLKSFLLISLIFSFLWIFGCGKLNQESKEFYIYTTGLAYQSQGEHPVEIFKEFLKVHADILKEYLVHIVHYDPVFATKGVHYWQEQFGALLIQSKHDQVIKEEYFSHEAKHPHIIFDGADIYGQKVYQEDHGFYLKTVLSNEMDIEAVRKIICSTF